MSAGGPRVGADELDALIADRPAETRTVPVDEEVFRGAQRHRRGTLRRMTAEEDAELARHLDCGVDDLAGPFLVVDQTCSGCDRRVTFLDFVRTATDDGHHALDRLRGVLTGEHGGWITLRCRDGGRDARCVACGTAIAFADAETMVDDMTSVGGYCEYTGSTYAYV